MAFVNRQAGREVVWAISRTLARPTARWRVLPDFLVVGGQRCGTTSIHEVLSAHPNVAGPRWMKGVHYFDTSYGRSVNWYRSNFHTTGFRSMREFSGRRPYLAGEISPYYLFQPRAAERIRRTAPDARIVIMLRNPVDRAISHHRHEQLRFGETLSLEAALDAEEQRLAGTVRLLQNGGRSAQSYEHQHHSYVARGKYAEQVARYIELFGRNRVLVLQSEAFFVQPEDVYERLLCFLGLPICMPRHFPKTNAAGAREVTDAIRIRLSRTFADTNEQLFDLIGERFEWK